MAGRVHCAARRSILNLFVAQTIFTFCIVLAKDKYKLPQPTTVDGSSPKATHLDAGVRFEAGFAHPGARQSEEPARGLPAQRA